MLSGPAINFSFLETPHGGARVTTTLEMKIYIKFTLPAEDADKIFDKITKKSRFYLNFGQSDIKKPMLQGGVLE